MSLPVSRFRQKWKGLCLALSQVNKGVMECLMEIMRKSGQSYLRHMRERWFFVVSHSPEHKSRGILENKSWRDFLTRAV